MATAAETTFAGGFPPATDQEWREGVERVLKGAPFERLVSRTADGIEVQPLYTDGPDEASTGAPGAAPFTRGFSAAQRAGGMWDVRAPISGSDPVENNRTALRELERGATSLLLSRGVLLNDESLAAALQGVHLDLAAVVLRAGPTFLDPAEWLMRLWADSGIADEAARGGFGADPLATLALTGNLGQGVDRALADAAGLASMAASRYPGVRAITVDATVYAEAGASEATEIAAALSTGAAYLRAMSDAGLEADAAGAQMEIVLGADPDFFTTIAKLRAVRRVWAVMVQACGVDPAAAPPALSVRTLDRFMSRRDPWVNLLRVTSATLGGVLGGADSITTLGFDAELGQSGELGRRMARNTQLLLGEESGVGRVIDPAGGSWYVETLTEQLAEESWSQFRTLEGAGGLPTVLIDGTLAARIVQVRDDRLASVARRNIPITGVSEFPSIDEEAPEVAGHPYSRTASDQGPATLCEPLVAVRWSQEFEALRDAADASALAAERPSVFLANLGGVATHTARASWAKNFFEAGGIATVTSDRGRTTGFEEAEAVAADFAASGSRIVCLCSSDEGYAQWGAPVASALASAGAERVYLAGRPGELGEALEAAGVDQFVHVGVDVLAALRSAHQLLDIDAVEVTS